MTKFLMTLLGLRGIRFPRKPEQVTAYYVMRRSLDKGHLYVFRYTRTGDLLTDMLRKQANPELDWCEFDTRAVLLSLDECEMGGCGK